MLQNTASQPDSSHRPRTTQQMTYRITGHRKQSEISEKGQDQFSNNFLHACMHDTREQLFYTRNTRLYTCSIYRKPSHGGRVMITLEVRPKIGGGGEGA